MKSRNRANVIIATTVVGCSAVLLGALTIALGGFQWKRGGRSLQIDFHDATGIKLHSPVRYAGAIAGSVTQLRYLTAEERAKAKDHDVAVRVTVRLDDAVPPIPSDTSAGLSSETMLGEKFIALTAGNPAFPPLADGAVITGRDVSSMDAVAGAAQQAIENVNKILVQLNSDYPRLVPRLADLLEQGNSLLSQGSNFMQNANGAMTNANGAISNVGELVAKFRTDTTQLISQLDALLGQGRGIATNADHAVLQAGALLGNADKLIQNNEPGVHQLLEELRVVSQNLKVITTYTKALTGTLGAKPSRLIWGSQKNPLPSEQQILESTQPVLVPLPEK